MRRTLRASMKAGGALIDLKYLGPKTKQPPIVALLDISGSMSQYTRLFLHFLHAVTDARKRVHTFLFGTRLTNVTRALKRAIPTRRSPPCSASVDRLVGRHAHRDLAARLQQALGAPRADAGRDRAADHRRAGARSGRRARVRDRPAAPLVPAADLAQSAAALRRLRGQGASGIRAMLPHVDEFRPIHNLESIGELCRALSAIGGRARRSEGVAEEGGVTISALPMHGDDRGDDHGLARARRRHPESRRGLAARPGAASRSRPWSRPGARRRGRSAPTW